MLNLNDKKSHYIIITAEKDSDIEFNEERNSMLESSLFRRDYRLIHINRLDSDIIKGGISFLATKDILPVNNNEIRYDVIEMIYQYSLESVIVKYIDDETPTRVFKDGSEQPMSLVNYVGVSTINESYVYNGLVFSFSNRKRYYKPNKLSDFKKGMIIEYFNDNKIWVEKEIINPVTEYNNMYKLLIKYDRIRCSE